MLRKSVEVFLHDMSLTGVDGIKKSLVYVLPQLNFPSFRGRPSHQHNGFWANNLRWQGNYSVNMVNPRHLQGDQAFEEVLHNRAMAKTAIIQAEDRSEATTSTTEAILWNQLSLTCWSVLLLLEGCTPT